MNGRCVVRKEVHYWPCSPLPLLDPIISFTAVPRQYENFAPIQRMRGDPRFIDPPALRVTTLASNRFSPRADKTICLSSGRRAGWEAMATPGPQSICHWRVEPAQARRKPVPSMAGTSLYSTSIHSSFARTRTKVTTTINQYIQP